MRKAMPKPSLKSPHGEEEDSDSQSSQKPLSLLQLDDVYDRLVGTHGLWQVMIVILFCLSTSSAMTFPVYANAVPRFRCKMEPAVEKALAEHAVSFHEAATLIGPWPKDPNDEGLHQGRYGCRRYQVTNRTIDWQKLLKNRTALFSGNSSTEPCPYGHVFYPWEHQYPSGIAADWNLVCEEAWKVPFSTSVYMVGMMIGFMLGGVFGDHLGRKKTIFMATFLECGFGLAVSFSPNYAAYTVLRALLSLSCTIKVTSISVFLVEMTNARYRSIFGAPWAIYVNFVSRAVHALAAMYINNWRYLHLIVVAPPCIGVFALYFLPESPRWLVSQNRLDEAVSTLYRAYRINNLLGRNRRPIMTRSEFIEELNHDPTPVYHESTVKGITQRCKLCIQNCDTTVCAKTWEAVKGPYQTGDLAKRSIVSTCIFAGQLCCFFGLLYYTRIIRGSIYLISFINACTSLPATFLSTILYSCVRSRRMPLLALYSMAGIVLLIGGLYTVILQPSSEMALIVCCNLALALLGATFNMIFIYIPELYPATLRTEGLGNASGLGRVGSIVSSFINELDQTFKHGFPVVVYAAVTFAVVMLLCCTPDTTGDNIKDKLEDEKSEKEVEAEDL
ncbi:unnamed protein product [Dibothriocephalus latus]|uniref:Major facilitator superfamily (MFS) profile domain-containing protein n=1 Tax=Dibothriocephalus latus TaxID=60516 RepID=A0A3P7P253_DIBLA|nr:unnamed protein product [Dibothriocephalus latus]